MMYIQQEFFNPCMLTEFLKDRIPDIYDKLQ